MHPRQTRAAVGRACYEAFGDERFMVDAVAWIDDGLPILVLEDMSDGYWPGEWRPGDVDAVVDALTALHDLEPPPGLRRLEDHAELFDSWQSVADAPKWFLSLGIADEAWLTAHLDILLEATLSVPLAGDSVLHLDVRSDNIVLTEDRAMLVDWNWALRGNPIIDLAFWLPSLAMEGGPDPDDILPDAPTYAALVSGFFAARAGKPLAGSRTMAIKRLQERQLSTSLPWACRALEIPLPTRTARIEGEV